MTPGEVIGLVGLLVTFGGLMAGMWWRLTARIAAGDAALHARIDRGDAELHARINKTRDEYVRRDDLMDHIDRIETSVNRVHERLDSLFEPRAARTKGG